MNFKEYISLIEEDNDLVTRGDDISTFIYNLQQHSKDLGSPKQGINIPLKVYQNENGPFVPRHIIHIAPPDGHPGPDVPQPIVTIHANPHNESLIQTPGRWFVPMEKRALTPGAIASNFPTFIDLHSKPMHVDKVWQLWLQYK
tara:strand:+ start:4600 stop:5028 length:429 start_codon:yes stop_codon:yes gene_type:complete